MRLPRPRAPEPGRQGPCRVCLLCPTSRARVASRTGPAAALTGGRGPGAPAPHPSVHHAEGPGVPGVGGSRAGPTAGRDAGAGAGSRPPAELRPQPASGAASGAGPTGRCWESPVLCWAGPGAPKGPENPEVAVMPTVSLGSLSPRSTERPVGKPVLKFSNKLIREGSPSPWRPNSPQTSDPHRCYVEGELMPFQRYIIFQVR